MTDSPDGPAVSPPDVAESRTTGTTRPDGSPSAPDRHRLAEVFGDVLPDPTRDERAFDEDPSRDEELLRDVPPHHG